MRRGPWRVLCWARSWRAALRAAFTLGLYLFSATHGAKRKIRREVCLSFGFWPPKASSTRLILNARRNELALRQGFRRRRKSLYGANAPPRRAGSQPMSASLSSMHGTPEQAICACSGFSKGDACAYLAASSLPRCSWLFFRSSAAHSGSALDRSGKTSYNTKAIGCSAVGSAHGSGP